jgi:N-acetylneuraminic acid mutarotase
MFAYRKIKIFKMIIKQFRSQFLLYSVLTAITFVLFVACDNTSEEEEDLVGNWIELSDLDGVPRSDAVVFTIGSKAYVGAGYDGADRLTDFWEYDPSKNSWKEIAEFPGVARNGAIAFGTDTKGYVGTGYDGTNKLKDFWEYNPTTDTWTQKADFAGSERYGAIAFSINNKGYVGSGFDGDILKDLWQYDPSTDSWKRKTSMAGDKRKDAVAFVMNDKGYVVTGIDNGTFVNDFVVYDPATDSWTENQKISNATDESFDDDYTSITGTSKVAFVIGDKAYLVGGSGSVAGTVWEYDPLTDLWELKTDLEGSARIEAVGFAFGTRGYITTGRSSSYYFDDIWGFDPFSEYNKYD